MIQWNAAYTSSSQALSQIVLQATLHTICEICHPILLFGTILLLTFLRFASPYTLIWHYTFIRHTRVHDGWQKESEMGRGMDSAVRT